MNNLKKKQHYVWKYYLKAWAKDEQILCKRIDNIFLTSLENIAQKRFFYESIELNDTELIFVMSFLRANPSAEKSLTRLLNLYLINSKADEYIKLCGIEEFHGVVESNAITILDSLYQKDLSFFKNDEHRNNFGFFLGCQYTRTSKMRNNFIISPLDVPRQISKEKVSKVFTLFFADIIGNWIYSKSKIKLLINKSDLLSFITGDQPVINAKADGNSLNSVQQLELYYPISPKIAIYLNEKDEGIEEVDYEHVKVFNKMILEHSYEQIYAVNRVDFPV